MKKLARYAAPVLAATALVAGTSAPALAARTVGTDTASDVTFCPPSYPCELQANRVEGDLRSMVTNHGSTAVIVRAAFADLVDYTNQKRAAKIAVATNEGQKLEFAMYWRNGGTTPTTYEIWDGIHSRSLAACGQKAVADYTANTITVTIPRACLSNPSWVKTGGYFGRGSNWGTIHDIAYDDGVPATGLVPYVYGPTTYRG